MRVVIEVPGRSAEIGCTVGALDNEVCSLAAALVNAIKSIGFYPEAVIKAMQKEASET